MTLFYNLVILKEQKVGIKLISIKGNVRYIIYESSTGYKVGRFHVKNTDSKEMEEYKNRTIAFTGLFAELNKEDTYTFIGEYVYNDKYGYQFNVNEYKKEKPEGKDAIIEFLTSKLIKGCGVKTAQKIVETLGENALTLIKEDPRNLLLVPNMTEKKAQTIYNSLIKYDEKDELIVELQKIGFTLQEVLLLIEEYDNDLKDIIKNNIYELREFIDFAKLDKIYLEKGEKTSEVRVLACIIESIKNLEFNAGDTYHYQNEIVSYLNKNYNIPYVEIDSYLEKLKENKEIYIKEDKIFLYETYLKEKTIAENLYLINNSFCKKVSNMEAKIKQLENELEVKYNEEQKEAIIKALNNNICIITGGPGTGKTTIINAIVKMIIKENNLNNLDILNAIAMLAPTGRASKRMSESTHLPAMTIHRFLKWNKDDNSFQINEKNKTTQKFIIVDEVSMIDTNLFDALLKGIYSNIKLILVGDANQLPSVGAGLVLSDLISSQCFCHVELNMIYRQSANSYIPDLAKEIREYNVSTNFLEQKDDYNFLNVTNSNIKSTLAQICQMSKQKNIDEKTMQILAPMYKGENGIDNLNILLQNIFNPQDHIKKEIKIGDVIYREKDKVIQLVNDPDNNVYNGDIGYVYKIGKNEHNKNVITIDFDGNYIEYLKEEMINIKHAYAMTIHKAQGSEFNHVILLISSTYHKMLYNKLIYTGVSRAKKSLVIIGNPNSFLEAVKNPYSNNRKTNLQEMIMNIM